MSVVRHDQELSLDQLGAIAGGIRIGFVVGPVNAQGNVRRPCWVRPNGFDVETVATPQRHII